MPRRSGSYALLALVLLLGCSERPTGDRVLVVGIDAATWDVIRPLMAAGRLPTFTGLVRSGWSATLESMNPTFVRSTTIGLDAPDTPDTWFPSSAATS